MPGASKASEDADSIALNPHKWLHAPFEAGCVLVRDAAAHRGTFAVTPEYLESTVRVSPRRPGYLTMVCRRRVVFAP